jgi:dephospho-CoA kinase
MLRVALTGGLGAGKSTAARMFRELGAHVLSSDEMGREMMQPGQDAYRAIVAHFGPGVVLADGALDRPTLAKIAFSEGRVEELNSIIHPAVIARQAAIAQEIAAREPDAVVMVESALVFETKYLGPEGLRQRFDKVILLTASEKNKIDRFVARTTAAGDRPDQVELQALEAEARKRIAQQIPDEQKISLSDYVLTNDGSEQELRQQIGRLWPILQSQAAAPQPSGTFPPSFS